MLKGFFYIYYKSILMPYRLLQIFLLFLLFSCQTKEDNHSVFNQNISVHPKNGGIVLTFDDDYVDDWFDLNRQLMPYNWKGTFFVTHFDKLPEREIRELRYLQIYGNEIGGHGLNHLNSIMYIKDFGGNQFMQNEINPMLHLMYRNGFKVASFSYPYGARNKDSDDLLFKHFKFLRGTTYGSENPEKQNCYYNYNPLVYGLGIDSSYEHFNLDYYFSILKYAQENNKIAVFYAHKTVPKTNGKYQTDYETLIKICKYVKENNMNFYTMSDLEHIKQPLIEIKKAENQF